MTEDATRKFAYNLIYLIVMSVLFAVDLRALAVDGYRILRSTAMAAAPTGGGGGGEGSETATPRANLH